MKPGPDAEPVDIDPAMSSEPPVTGNEENPRQIKLHDQVNSRGLIGDSTNEFSGVHGILLRHLRDGIPLDSSLAILLGPRKLYEERLQDVEDRMTAPFEYDPDPSMAAHQKALQASYAGYKTRVIEATVDHPQGPESVKQFNAAVNEYNEAIKKYRSAVNPDEQQLALTEMLAASEKGVCLYPKEHRVGESLFRTLKEERWKRGLVEEADSGKNNEV